MSLFEFFLTFISFMDPLKINFVKSDLVHFIDIDLNFLVEKYGLGSNQINIDETKTQINKDDNLNVIEKKKKKFFFNFTSSSNQYDITELIVKEYFLVSNYKLNRKKLCPRVTNRLEYLKKVEQYLMDGLKIVKCKKSNFIEKPIEKEEKRWIIDIGTGSSLIYPIIGMKMNDRNHFIVTEIDPESILDIKKHINSNNNFENRIFLIEMKENEDLIPLNKIIELKKKIGISSISYLICNPPFYSNEIDYNNRSFKKKKLKKNELIISKSECFYNKENFDDGGELLFVKQIIQQSLSIQTSFDNEIKSIFFNTWFTSQIGIYDNYKKLLSYFKEIGIKNFTSFTIDFQTKRWVISWSFNNNLHAIKFFKKIQPPNILLENTIFSLNTSFTKIKQQFSNFSFDFIKLDKKDYVFFLYVNEQVWTRSFRNFSKHYLQKKSSKYKLKDFFNKFFFLALTSSIDGKISTQPLYGKSRIFDLCHQSEISSPNEFLNIDSFNYYLSSALN